MDTSETTRVVEFNDVDGLEKALSEGDVAAILVEPALTNIGIVLPDEGYNEAVRELATKHGAMLINDETHTICAGPGGITRRDNLHPDFLVIGKSIGAGMPCGTFGFTQDVADRIARSVELEDIDVGGIGGTLAGNGLSMAAMKATLEHVMTQDAFDHMIPLADAWADGIQAGIDAVRRAVTVTRLGARAEYNFSRAVAERAGGARRRRLRAAAVPPPLRAQPRHPPHPVPQHGPHVARHDARDVDTHTAMFDACLQGAVPASPSTSGLALEAELSGIRHIGRMPLSVDSLVSWPRPWMR